MYLPSKHVSDLWTGSFSLIMGNNEKKTLYLIEMPANTTLSAPQKVLSRRMEELIGLENIV